MTLEVEGTDDTISAEFDTDIFPLLALQKTAYEFSNRAATSLVANGGTNWLVTLTAPSGNAPLLLEQFKARVTDLALQEKINEQTRTVRDALVTAAMWESLPGRPS
jgi:His-Xaa-Ser system protein HxsD